MPEQASPSVFRHFDCPIIDDPSASCSTHCYSVAEFMLLRLHRIFLRNFWKEHYFQVWCYTQHCIPVFNMCTKNPEERRRYDRDRGSDYWWCPKTGIIYIIPAVRSLLSPVFCVFSNFAPIPMYRENETPCAIPTYRVLPHSLIVAGQSLHAPVCRGEWDGCWSKGTYTVPIPDSTQYRCVIT